MQNYTIGSLNNREYLGPSPAQLRNPASSFRKLAGTLILQVGSKPGGRPKPFELSPARALLPFARLAGSLGFLAGSARSVSGLDAPKGHAATKLRAEETCSTNSKTPAMVLRACSINLPIFTSMVWRVPYGKRVKVTQTQWEPDISHPRRTTGVRPSERTLEGRSFPWAATRAWALPRKVISKQERF